VFFILRKLTSNIFATFSKRPRLTDGLCFSSFAGTECADSNDLALEIDSLRESSRLILLKKYLLKYFRSFFKLQP